MRRRFCWEATNFEFLIYTTIFNGNLPKFVLHKLKPHGLSCLKRLRETHGHSTCLKGPAKTKKNLNLLGDDDRCC